MTDFKNIKHYNCSLDFYLTFIDCGSLVYPPANAFLEEVDLFFIHDMDVESASEYVAGKHQILTTMNISGSCVIHIVIMLCLPLTWVWHLLFISKLKAGSL